MNQNLKHVFYSLVLILFIFGNQTLNAISSASNINIDRIEEGDIIFQVSTSSQSRAIQIATKSKYSHMGIIIKRKNSFFVFEAIYKVKFTPLLEWIARGQDSHFVIKRIINAKTLLSKPVLEKMKKIITGFKGKNYDFIFGWSDESIYCSELVWKIYKRALNLEIGKLQKLKDFDLSHPIVLKKIKERFGNKIPTEELVISPIQMFNSNLLTTIQEN